MADNKPAEDQERAHLAIVTHHGYVSLAVDVACCEPCSFGNSQTTGMDRG